MWRSRHEITNLNLYRKPEISRIRQ